ncbi:hypothetical protein N0V93_003190 [Gnomoniopsis smithogilvyi]|uniref:histidine kinase n=1 Tax=Gnomoniopsis smithogilvyi TaxID=1191159 RepID=A0A9W9CZS8_9PEZI|nr:hypothetical protein N0V93_003190 [Gnomoniopsis smithogilvyi]
MRPEAARERDLHRYYKPWKDAQNNLVDVKSDEHGNGNAWGLTYEGYKPRASGDKTLTAFAQLATLRLNVRRAMVSLVDSTQQYILAEATQTLSLVSDERHEPGDEIWLGNTILKRTDAVCHHSFGQKYTAEDDNGEKYTAEALVIPNMRLDDRFKDRSYVKQEPGIMFYAGVPIRTKSGHRIGVYAVSSEKPRPGLSVDELIFMEDVAAAVMEHLELAKDRDARVNGEKMVRGLADFIEGTEEPDVPLAGTTVGGSPSEDQIVSPRISAVMRKQSENALKMLDDLDEITGSTTEERNPTDTTQQEEKPAKTRISRDDPSRILARAANIIRQSTEADGVIFFNTSSRNFQGLSRRGLRGGNTDLSSGMNSGSDISNDPTVPARQRQTDQSTDSGEDLRMPRSNTKPRRRLCEVIGMSISQHEQYGRLDAKDFGFPEENMERYIQNFPYGKYFSFTDTGSGISSGDELSSEDKPAESSNPTLERRPSGARKDAPPRNKNQRFIPAEMLKVLPGIRSLIFLPLWDFTEGRYIAGGFIWTSIAGRLMSPENELPYLKAFGNSIMSEIARVKATKSDLAKTTFIASISHELRSPLHGILGSVEFLHETAVSAYQEGLFTSIETCGKTLLDTIDHVLDYAKINKLRKGSASRKRANQRVGQRKDHVGSIVGLTTNFDLAALVEEVVDAVTAGHVFRRSHQVTAPEQDAYGVALAGMGTAAPPKQQSEPVVILDIAPRENWFVRTQPGALRRIVMNLLGNALKYTDAGFVSVTLQVESETDDEIKVHFRFVDSGRGMSLEFQRTRLFAPFSQEDPFSTGTGLGLSIVRQIVEAHDGNIAITSAQYVGTEVDVTMTLPVVGKVPGKPTLDPPLESTKGTTVCMVNLVRSSLSTAEVKGLQDLRDTLRETCEGWFGMTVVDEPGPTQPDFLLLPMIPTSAQELLDYYHASSGSKVSAPLIALCGNTGEASQFRNKIAGRLLEHGIESIPITQPLGPRKLASVIEKFKQEQIRHKQRIVLGRKESDPEAIRRERDILRRVHEAQIAEQEKGEKQASARPTSPEQTRVPLPRRPGPSALIQMEAIDENQEIPSEPLESPTQNMILARVAADNSALRSRSAPPGPSFVLAESENASDRGRSVTSSAHPYVLLVDDNAINLQLLVMFMKKQNLPYATASNGLLALERYQDAFSPSQADSPASRHSAKPSPPFTHVLMDISMPIMDGLTSTRKIRAFEAEKGIAPPSTIIALTGLASAEAQEDALNAGINEFLVKPVKFGELKGLLNVSGSN